MDDVPPGPTAPGPRRPALSVVIPVHNGGHDFDRCLRRLRETIGPDFELIVVDDGSTDGSAARAEAAGARVIANPTPLGPASARNRGAEAARANLVFFLDADVAVHPETLARAVARFEADPELTALFGSYDDQPAAPGLVSRFRNLLHHFIHQQGEFQNNARSARTFWTGCGAIRRRAFLDSGGFDPRLYTRPAIEDIELGYRLTRAGHRIVLARDVLGTHLKRWTIGAMIRTDIFQRGVPWALLLKRQKFAETDLNVRPAQKVCVAVTGLAILAILVSPWYPIAASGATLAPVTVVALNRAFYAFLRRRRGLAFAAGSVPVHLVYYASCGISVVLAQILWLFWTPAAQDRTSAESRPSPRGPRAKTVRRSRWVKR